MVMTFKDSPFEPKASSTQTVIARDTRFNGEVTGSRALRIEGSVSGAIKLKAPVEIAEGAVVEAEISASAVRVAGTVIGSIVATEMLELLASAVIKGDVSAPALHVVAGARLDGRVQMVVETPAAPVSRKA